jgi:thiamine-phosphate diphosphorylase
MTPDLGPLLVLTDRTSCTRPLVDVVAAAVDGGARSIVLREKDLPTTERARLADALRALLAPVDGLLVLAGTWLPGDALHLSSADELPGRRPRLLGRSCHDAAEVAAAGTEGCDWATVSPVLPTASKPGYGPPLRAAGLAALVAVEGAPPLYALGGVTAAAVPELRSAGASGVAVMGAVMRAEHPDRCVAELLGAGR